MKKLLLLLVKGYQRLISPLTPPRCRFQPTCSHYAMDALEQHGALKGSWLTLKRLGKCHPLHPGGWDPVPDPRTGNKMPLYDEAVDDDSLDDMLSAQQSDETDPKQRKSRHDR